MESTAITKLPPVASASVPVAELIKLDPSVPYVILLDEKTPNEFITELQTHLSAKNVYATIIKGKSPIQIFASLPWNVGPAETLKPVARKRAPAKKASKKKVTTKE